jgi:type IV pilus assembly protein PilA
MKTIYQQRGQGMTEYIVIVALVAVAAIATYQFLGQTVRNQTASIAQEIAGNANTAQAQAITNSTSAANAANVHETLDSYDGNVNK